MYTVLDSSPAAMADGAIYRSEKGGDCVLKADHPAIYAIRLYRSQSEGGEQDARAISETAPYEAQSECHRKRAIFSAKGVLPS
jgi:hypothetical protein